MAWDRIIKESEVEKYLVKKVGQAGGWAIKLLPWVVSGLPDRMVLIQGLVFFVETKKPKGATISPRQKFVAGQFLKLGFIIHYCFTKDQVDAFAVKVYEKIQGS